ncbi:hypothetical protein V6N11_075706 [Hibiscus sabdariffa]|uniref:Uncharacterized protein n=1 Tax=Hibiscus sabdariffa TaxID=183260 RepID=A0ABR2N763_9ROSI
MDANRRIFISTLVPMSLLLDDDFDARIADFGLARLMGSRDLNDSSFMNGDLGEFEEGFKGNLVDWVNRLFSTGRSKDAVNRALVGKGDDDEIMQFLRIACTCVVPRPKDRPSMYQVYESLKSMGEKHGAVERYDEFPLIFGKQQDHDK